MGEGSTDLYRLVIMVLINLLAFLVPLVVLRGRRRPFQGQLVCSLGEVGLGRTFD